MRHRWAVVAQMLTAGCAAPTLADADPPLVPERYDGHAVVRVTPRTLTELRLLHALSDDLWTCAASRTDEAPLGRAVDMRFTPESLAALKTSGIEQELLIPDVQALIDRERAALAAPPLRGPGYFDDFRNLSAVSDYADVLRSLRPDLVSRESFGLSVKLKPLWAMRITRPGGPAAGKPKIVVISAQHSREWITVTSAMYLADALVRREATDQRVRSLLETFEFVIVPVFNPDGYDLTWTTTRLWRKNLRTNADSSIGVDLNRNWAQGWGSSNGSSGSPGSETYRGPTPFSEPETAALRDYLRSLGNVAAFFDVHSYGQLILAVRGDDHAMSSQARSLESLGTLMQTAMFESTGKVYQNGPIYRTIYPVSGGASDWVAVDRGTLGLSFELRDTGQGGFILPATEIVPTGNETVAGVLAAADWLSARRVFASFSDGVPANILSDSSTRISVQFNRGSQRLADLAAQPARVMARLGRIGPFSELPISVPSSDNAGPVFTHALPAGPCGSITQWYYLVPMWDGSEAVVGSDIAGTPFEAVSRTGQVVFADDFQTDRGWLLADTSPANPDLAGAGAWSRVDPNGTVAQPEDDHTPGSGTLCMVTGQQGRGSTNGAEVSGKTTLISPLLDLSGSAAAEIALWIFFYNGRAGGANDQLLIDVTFNGGAASPTWIRAATVAPLAEPRRTGGNWVRYAFSLASLGVPSAQTRLRVVANDQGPANVIEVLVDDVTVTRLTCEKPPCAADFDGTGVATVDDVFAYISAWFADGPGTDVDGSGSLSIDDLFVFLRLWFAGCP